MDNQALCINQDVTSQARMAGAETAGAHSPPPTLTKGFLQLCISTKVQCMGK